jgi:YceI-like domain
MTRSMAKYILLFVLLIPCIVHAQKFTTESGVISFFSDASIEDISAQNASVGSIFDTASGDIVFMVPIKDFQFDKRLMREHFNEKYMETHKFPKASFKGKVTGYQSGKSETQQVKVIGKLTMHGVTRDLETPGTIEFQTGKLIAKSKFMIKLADYNISVPQIVWQNIAEQVEVNVAFTYKAL